MVNFILRQSLSNLGRGKRSSARTLPSVAHTHADRARHDSESLDRSSSARLPLEPLWPPPRRVPWRELPPPGLSGSRKRRTPSSLPALSGRKPAAASHLTGDGGALPEDSQWAYAAILTTVDGQIFEEKKAGLASHDDIEISVAIDIDHRNLQSATRPAAVVDNVPDPLESSPTLDGLVPVNTQRFVRPRIVLVCILTLTRHEDFLSITLQVHARQRLYT